MCLLYFLVEKCPKKKCKKLKVEIEGTNYKGSCNYRNIKRCKIVKKEERRIMTMKKERGKFKLTVREPEKHRRDKRNCVRFFGRKWKKCMKRGGKFILHNSKFITKTLLTGKYRPKYNLTLTVDTLATEQTCEPWQVPSHLWKKTKRLRNKRVTVKCTDMGDVCRGIPEEESRISDRRPEYFDDPEIHRKRFYYNGGETCKGFLCDEPCNMKRNNVWFDHWNCKKICIINNKQ